MRPETSKEEFFKKNTASTESDPAMDKWTEDMEETAKISHSEEMWEKGDLIENEGVFSPSNDKVNYSSGDSHVYLEDNFTIQQLEALTLHMKKYAKEEK